MVTAVFMNFLLQVRAIEGHHAFGVIARHGGFNEGGVSQGIEGGK